MHKNATPGGVVAARTVDDSRSWKLPRTSWSMVLVAWLAMTGCGSSSTSISLENSDDAPADAEVQVATGDYQSGVVGQALSEPLSVIALDAQGNALSGIPVTWTFGHGVGRAIGSPTRSNTMTLETGDDGGVQVVWELGEIAGPQFAWAEIGTASTVLTQDTDTDPAPAPRKDNPGLKKGKKVGFNAKASAGGLAEIVVSPTALDAHVGDVVMLMAAAVDDFGNKVMDAEIEWLVSDQSVVTVSPSVTLTDEPATSEAMSPGTATITVQTGGVSTSVDATIASSDAPATDSVVITTTSLPNGRVGASYAQTLQMSGGSGTNSWSVTSGALPAGLTLRAASGEIVGSPTTSGTSSFTVQVTSDGSSDTQELSITVESTSTSPADDLVFHSDFSTALGRSPAALLDTDQAVPWTQVVGNGDLSEVVSSTGLDFPTANVLRVEAGYLDGVGGAAETLLLDGVLPIPAVGESLYYRWYMRMVEPDDFTADYSTHPMQDGLRDQNWVNQVINRRDSSWSLEWSSLGSSWPNSRWRIATPLAKGQTYRIEVRFHRVGNSTYNLYVRVYDAAGVLLYDNDDFNNANASGTLAEIPALNLVNASSLADFTAGFNGKAGGTAADYPIVLYYQSGFCVRTQDWCGAY